MEVEDIQTQPCKFPRIGNGRNESNKIGQKGGDPYPDEEDDGELKRDGVIVACGGTGGSDGGGGTGRLRGWHHSSRIFRVSRASGGKDRHSKVLTSKGLRDRRVRLSVTTAIQFYDLQDRLGYDQPSKAVEWLIKAASDSIAELPSLNSSFPDTPRQPSDEKRPTEQGFINSADVELEGEPNYQHHHQHQQHVNSLSKSSACSSTSETSKGSGLSLSRSENRVKARERARERAAKEKEKEKENDSRVAHQQNVNHMSQSSSFTELLTAGINNTVSSNTDYFSTGFLGPPSSSRTHHSSSGFSGQIQLTNSLPQSMTVSPFNVNVAAVVDHHPELHPFSFVHEHLIPAGTTAGSTDYNLNFTISSGLAAGFNRGTLQSNSPSLLPHLQRFSQIDGSNIPFFNGTAASAAASPVENNHHHHHHHHHQFPPGFDAGLNLCYGDGSRHSEQKGKGKN